MTSQHSQVSAQDGDGAAGAASPLRVMIYGSCVSRDAFTEATTDAPVVLEGYYSRSSLASLSSAPAAVHEAVDRITSAFQRRMVKADHDKSLLSALRTADYDILLIDLIDERFHLLRQPGGTLVTLSNEYVSVAERPFRGAVIPSGSPEHVRLWRKGLERMADALAAAGRMGKVRINAVYWAERDVEGKPVAGFLPEQTAQANAFLRDRYKDLEAVFGPAAFLRYAPEMLVSDRLHRWGVSAFHFAAPLYRSTLTQLGIAVQPPSPTDAVVRDPVAPEAAGAAERVTLASTPLGLTATVEAASTAGTEFAYYLLRDKQRVAALWYSPRTSVTFPCPTVSGSYGVSVFERHRASGGVQRYRSSTLRLPDPSRYSTLRWSRSVEVYGPGRPLRVANGVHRFIAEDKAESLDFLLQGFDATAPTSTVIVCFGAAVSGREQKVAPFFSGTSIGKACGLPMVCVADPTLARANDIGLGWYAGNDEVPQLCREIAARLDELSESCATRRLLLIGGSGGGFAALSVLGFLRREASAIVWNAQTSISRYHIGYVHRYVRRAFPEISRKQRVDRLSASRITRDQLADCMDEAGVLHDLTRAAPLMHHPALYLLNRTDAHHLEQHLEPLLAARGARWSSPVQASDSTGLLACVGDWAEGHAPPPAPFIEKLITELARGVTVGDLAGRLVQLRQAAPPPNGPGTSEPASKDEHVEVRR